MGDLMAGRPMRRARRLEAADRLQLPEFPERKPVDQMTPDEVRECAAEVRRRLRAEMRELERPQREMLLRHRAEWELFAKDLIGDRGDEPPEE